MSDTNHDLTYIVADTLGDSLGGVPAQVHETTAADVLAALAAPENQTPLMDWLVSADIPYTLIGALVRTGHLKLEIIDRKET